MCVEQDSRASVCKALAAIRAHWRCRAVLAYATCSKYATLGDRIRAAESARRRRTRCKMVATRRSLSPAPKRAASPARKPAARKLPRNRATLDADALDSMHNNPAAAARYAGMLGFYARFIPGIADSKNA